MLGFRKSGEHVVEIQKDGNYAELFTFEPNSRQINSHEKVGLTNDPNSESILDAMRPFSNDRTSNNILFLPKISGKMVFKPRPISQKPFLFRPHKDVYDDGIDFQGLAPKSTSQEISPIGITGGANSFLVSSYVETLLLLDH